VQAKRSKHTNAKKATWSKAQSGTKGSLIHNTGAEGEGKSVGEESLFMVYGKTDEQIHTH